MFTANPKPDHIQYPRGVLCLDCDEFIPAELERCIACGSGAVALLEQGQWRDGRPDPGHPHHVEHDLSTGMVGYTRLTKAEIAERAVESRRFQAEQKKAAMERELGLRQLREKAASDPAWAALARHLGISLD